MKTWINESDVGHHDEIFRTLAESLSKGTVVGIYTKRGRNRILLTCVEQFLESEQSHRIIVLKKVDLQGHIIKNNRIAISDITKVKAFSCRYKDKLSSALEHIAKSQEHVQHKIRAKEQAISRDDLMLLLIKMIDSGSKVLIRCVNSLTMTGYVSERGISLDTILISLRLNGSPLTEIRIADIAVVELEIFYQSNGLSSRRFRVNHDQQTPS